MKSLFKLLLIITSIPIWINCSDGQDFCQSYADNGYRLDLVYEHFIDRIESPPTLTYLFIGNNYWLLSIVSPSMYQRDLVNITLPDTNSRRHPLIGGQYKAAFDFNFIFVRNPSYDPKRHTNEDEFEDTRYQSSSSKPLTALLQANNTIDWTYQMANDSTGELLVDENGIFNSTNLNLEADFNPSFAFLHKVACFVKQTPSEGSGYLRSYRCYNFALRDRTVQNATDFMLSVLKRDLRWSTKGLGFENQTDYELFNRVDDREMIATLIYTQASLDMVFIYRKDRIITYCLSDYFALGCNESHILVDCSDTSPTETSTNSIGSSTGSSTASFPGSSTGSSPKSPTSSNMTLFLAIIIIGMIGLIVLFVFVCLSIWKKEPAIKKAKPIELLPKTNQTSDPTTTESSTDRQETKRSVTKTSDSVRSLL